MSYFREKSGRYSASRTTGRKSTGSRQKNVDWHKLYDKLEKTHKPQRDFVPYEVLEQDKSWYDKIHGPGSANFRKHRYPSSRFAPFCGPSGGAIFNTFPVNSPTTARSALAYARHAPNELGIRQCVHKVEKERGWLNKRMPQSEYASKDKRRSSRRVSFRRGPMKASARTHEHAKYPAIGGKYSHYFD